MVDNATGGAMGQKTAEEIVELYEMLGANSQQKSVRERRMRVNKEVCGLCGAFNYGANMCQHNVYEPEQVKLMNAN